MKRLFQPPAILLTIALLAVCGSTSSVNAQSPRERIAKLRSYLATAYGEGEEQDAGGKVVQASVTLSLTDRSAKPETNTPAPPPSIAKPSVQELVPKPTPLPSGYQIPAEKIPLPRSYHGQPSTGANTVGASEPG
ncbi:MAG: hypothetical protein GY904_17500, partial [Planctomycetaceae bacterium]|nr:hypothetical protein [Planctomycetaceae bacterium]